ncbi:MAG TPA: NAD(P)-dependent oxidoreductase [Planctomycetota bacterium]|nr:NAD(P)-dependent oxidoreductase [Planctomycetota bacterium]
MKAVFFELEGWEKPYLEARLPTGHKYEFLLHRCTLDDLLLIGDADIISTFIFSQMKGDVLKAAKSARLITTRSTGYDHVDCKAAAERGIAVANVPEYGSNTVAEHTLALLLALSRRIIPAYIRTKGGHFNTDGLRGFDLRGKTLGVVGTGNIGLHVIRMASSFGLNVIASDAHPRAALADVLGFHYVPFERLLGESDIITLHCPATPQTHHLIRAETITKMKKGAILINTARGSIVNTNDLLHALETRQIAGAGLDVFDGEGTIKEDAPVAVDADREQLIAAIQAHRLLTREDVIVTPHNAFNSEEAVRRILDTTVENIRCFIEKGAPAFPVGR